MKKNYLLNNENSLMFNDLFNEYEVILGNKQVTIKDTRGGRQTFANRALGDVLLAVSAR
jgi:ABC-type sulfate transport system substrate-binding protein